MDDSSREASADRSLRRDAPANLPRSPSLSYNPRTMRIAPFRVEEEPEETSGPTFQSDLKGDPTKAPPAALGETEVRGAEALGYTLLRLVGRGGMGEVWEAIQRRLWRRVAVKRMRPGANGSTLADDVTMRRTFEWEAMTSALLDHPNIVPVYDLGIDEAGVPLLAMKLVNGHGWNRILDADFKVMEAEGLLAKHLPILVQVAQAVAFAHSRGVVHRDLKPSQVMIGEFGEVLLMDWGLAVMVGEKPVLPREVAPGHIYPDLDSCENPAGTPGYMAPEQTEHVASNIGLWTDVYLLGGMLFNVMTGRRPHPGDSSDAAFRSAAAGRVTPWEEAAPGRHLPDELRALVEHALQPEPAARPSARNFIERLQDYLTGAGKRRESLQITNQLGEEQVEPTYAAYVNALTKLGQAQRLWPDNPQGSPLRERFVEGYAQLALESGDLTLARAQAERVGSAEARGRLLGGIGAAEERARLQRLRVRQFAALIIVLLFLVLVGGGAFTLQLKKANERTGRQLGIANEARAAEADARKSAQDELDRATLLLVDALIAQDRRNEAIDNLLSIPEEKRFWEWGFLLTRAMQDLWEVPFRYREYSPSREFVLATNETDGLCLLRAETGEVIAHTGARVVAGLRVRFSIDESIVAVYAADMPVSVFSTRTGDRLGSIETGAIPNTLEPSPDNSRLAIGYLDGRLEIHRLADGSKVELPRMARPVIGIHWGERRMVVVRGGEVWRHDLAAGTAEVLYSTPHLPIFHGWVQSSSDPRREWFAFGIERQPTFAGRVGSGALRSFPGMHYRRAVCARHPWLVTSSAEFSPRLAVWDIESGERVLWDLTTPMQAPEDPGAADRLPHCSNFSLSGSEGLILLNVGPAGRRELYTFPEHRHVPFPATVEAPGELGIELLPGGNAVWIAFEDRTVIRPIGAPYPGIRIPGHTSSIGIGDQYTSALRLSWFEQRDTEYGDLQFVGGRMFNLYLGGRLTKDLARIFIPGYRNEKFTIEKADRGSSRVLGTYVWDDEKFSTFALHPDREQFAGISEDGTRLASWSIAGAERQRQFEMTARPDNLFLGVVFDPTGDRLIVRTQRGDMLWLDAGTGEVRERLRAHDGPITGVIAVKGTDSLATYGADGHVRLWAPGGLQPTRDIAFGFPIAGAAITGDGSRILAWPQVGAPEIRGMRDGKLVCRLDRTDFPMMNVRFLSGDARVVSGGGGAARFWDTRTGRESYAMESGFGSISTDEKRMIHMTDLWEGMLIDIAPSRTADLPGDESMTQRERLDLWKIARYRKWSLAQQNVDLGHIWYEYTTDQRPLLDLPSGALAAGIQSLAVDVRSDMPGLAEFLAEELAALYMNQFDRLGDRIDAEFGGTNTWLFRRPLAKSPELAKGSVGLAAIVLGASRGKAFTGAEPASLLQESSTLIDTLAPIDSMARVLEQRGDHDRALQTARWLVALRLALGLVQGESGDLIARLGGELPAPPPAGLVALPGLGLPASYLPAEAAEAGSPTPGQDADRLAAAHARYRRDLVEYLAATPHPDWDELIAGARSSPDWRPFHREVSVAEYFVELAEKARTLALRGESLPELRAREGARVDAAFNFKMHPRTIPPTAPESAIKE